MSMIEELVAQKILKRGDKGLEKYGVSMADEQLPLLGWLNHLQEELMDASVYIEKIMLEEELKLLDNGNTNNETI